MKRIRFKNDWRYSRKGDVIEEGDGVALLLIQRGIAEEVPESEEVKSEEVPEKEVSVGEAGADEAETSESALSADPESALPQILTRRVPGPRERGRS